jgi:tetratricopeptide (TPR) repeat protein
MKRVMANSKKQSSKKKAASSGASKVDSKAQGDLPRYPPLVRLVLVVVLAVVAILLSVPISIWWQERPLGAAELELAAEKPIECIEQVDDFLREYPNHSRALGIKARALVRLGAMDAALAIFHAKGAYDPAEWQAWAVAHIAKQQWASALPLLNKVLDDEPDNSDAIEQITACFAMTGRYEEGIQSAQRLLKMPGYEARGMVRIGMIERDRNGNKKAIDHFEQALKLAESGAELSAESHQIQLELGKLYLLEKESVKAVEILNVSLNGSDQLATRSFLAEAYRQQGDIDKAVEQWKLTLKTDSLDIGARVGLAQVSLDEMKPDEALEWLITVKSLAKQHAGLANALHKTHSALKNEKEASEWGGIAKDLAARDARLARYEQVVRETPDSFWGRIIRAWREADQEQWQEAEQIMTNFKSELRDHAAVEKLNTAIKRKSKLPPLESLVDFTTTPKDE